MSAPENRRVWPLIGTSSTRNVSGSAPASATAAIAPPASGMLDRALRHGLFLLGGLSFATGALGLVVPLLPFFAVIALVLLLVTYVPAISMALPQAMGLVN